jgi:hypothetical protein
MLSMIVDWKSDVRPDPKIVEHYREQVRSYLAATGAMTGLIVFATSGTMIPVSAPADRSSGPKGMAAGSTIAI